MYFYLFSFNTVLYTKTVKCRKVKASLTSQSHYHTNLLTKASYFIQINNI